MKIPETVRFLFEPGRDVLADAGVLLTGIKRDIVQHSLGNIVVTDGSRMLMPSAQLRNRAHHTVFLDAAFNEVVDYSRRCVAKVRGAASCATTTSCRATSWRRKPSRRANTC